MKKLITFTTLIIILLTGCAGIMPSASTYNHAVLDNQSPTTPRFSIETMNIVNYEFEKTIFAVIPTIPYSEQRFVIKNNGFQSAVNVEAHLLDQGQSVLNEYFTAVTPIIADYRATKNPRLSTTPLLRYSMAAGYYQLNLRITNKETNESSMIPVHVKKREIKLNKLGISDLLLVDNNVDGKNILNSITNLNVIGLNMAPLNSQALNPWKPIKLVFELYTPSHLRQTDTLKQVIVKYSLSSETNPVLEKSIKIKAPKHKREVIEILFSLPENLDDGNYTLTLQAHIPGKATTAPVSKAIRFGSPIPRTKQEKKDALTAMKYVAPRSVVEKLRKAKTEEKKMKIFNDFWGRQNTGEGELEWFNYKIAQANKECGGSWNEKWRIAVRFGPPHDITRTNQLTIEQSPIDRIHGYQSFEIWHYFDLPFCANNRKRFIFKYIQRSGGIRNFDTMLNMDIKTHNNTEFNDYRPEKIFR